MDNSQCIRLISLYRENKCLWDPNDTNYTNRGKVREDAWRKISRQMNNIPTTELKKKMKSLSGGYRRERFREKQSRITGSDAEDTYKSKWFAYDEFAFMADKNDPGTTRDTIQQKYISQNNKKRNLAAEDQLKENIKIELQQENSNNESAKSESSNDLESNGSADHESVISDPLDEPNIVYKNVSESRSVTGIFQNLSEYDAVGINVGKKLSKMDPTQALYAESIINHVLRKGLLNKLKDVTDLCDRSCGSQQW